MTDWFEDTSCKHCGEFSVPYYGNELSEVLVIGAYPGSEEVDAGIPLVGPMGSMFKSELRYLGIHLDNWRYGNLWQHPANDKEECFKDGLEKTLKELEGKKAALLLGSEPVEHLLGKKVTDACGLFFMSHLSSVPMMACFNPAVVFQDNGVVGEVRLALRKFVKYVEKLEMTMEEE